MKTQGTIRMIIGTIIMMGAVGTVDADHSASIILLAGAALVGACVTLSGMKAKGLF